MRQQFFCVFRSGAWIFLLGVLGPLSLAASKNEAWLKLTATDFTVVTTLKEKEARAWAGEFSQFIAAMRNFFADGNRQLPPLTVVIFARDRDFQAYRPLDADGKPQAIAGYFARLESSAVAGLSNSTGSKDLRRTIFHEGTHWFMSGAGEERPVWLEEGFAEVFSTFEIEKGKAKWGSPIEEHVYVLREIDRLPLQKLLTIAQENLSHKDILGTGVIYAESWAFVHYLIFGEHKMPRRAVSEYVSLLQTMNSDEAFQRAFGRTVKEMDREFREYIGGGTYYMSLQPLAATRPIEVTVASVTDVSNALGRLAAVGGRTELAEKHAREAIAAAKDEPEGYVLLGNLMLSKEDLEGARAAFAEAVVKNTADGEAYFALATMEQIAATVRERGVRGMAADKARRIATLYERAIQLEPWRLEAFQNLAVILHFLEQPEPADRESLELGRTRFPRDPKIQIGLAELAQRGGENEKARALLRDVLGRPALAASARTFAVSLEEQWEQAEIINRVSELRKASRFTEAADYLGARLEQGVPIGVRRYFADLRREMQTEARIAEMNSAMFDRRWEDARKVMEAILESSPTPALKQHVKKTLEDLDRRKLGLTDGASSKPR